MKSECCDSKILISIYKKLYKHYGPQYWWPGNTRFEIIVGAILTQNTAWANVEKAIRNLKEERLLSPLKIRNIKRSKLSALIRPAGYYNVKTARLKNFIDFLYGEYGGSLNRLSRLETPVLRYEILSVSGIGPETCDSIILYAFGRPVFVIDAYTKRVFSRHHFFKAAAVYDEVKHFFMSRLPPDEKLYNEYHALIVRLAKDFCHTKPSCSDCPIRDA